MGYEIRDVTENDAADIVSIINYFIRETFAAYHTRQVGREFYEMLRRNSIGLPFYVAEDSDQNVIGFALLQRFHPADTFSKTASITYFIMPDHTGHGLGKKMLDKIIADAREKDIETILAHISSLNEGSINFHKRHGFRECGRFEKIGRKFNRRFDMVWMQKDI